MTCVQTLEDPDFYPGDQCKSVVGDAIIRS